MTMRNGLVEQLFGNSRKSALEWNPTFWFTEIDDGYERQAGVQSHELEAV